MGTEYAPDHSPPPALLLLSLEGTAVHDDGLVLRALRTVAADAALFPSEPWLRARAGQLPLELFNQMLANVGRRTPAPFGLVHRFDRVVGDAVDLHPPRLRRGILPVIQELRARGSRVALITALSAAIARRIQSRLGLDALVLVAAEDAGRGRPAPDPVLAAMHRSGVDDPEQVGICGSAPSDLIAGAAAGLRWVVGVGQGTHDLDELAAHPHTHLLRDLGDLLEVLHAPC
jgi:phosphonatase-like hydrolase